MANIAQPDLGVFQRVKTINDFDRLNQEFEMKKQLAAATQLAANAKMQKTLSGGDAPAAIQIVNEMEKARANGDVQRYNLLHQVAKSFAIDRGMTPEWNGPQPGIPPVVPQANMSPPQSGLTMNAPTIQDGDQNYDMMGQPITNLPPAPAINASGVGVVPGYTKAASAIEGAKAGAKEQAKKDVQLTMDPLIARDVEQSKVEGKEIGTTGAELRTGKARIPQLQAITKRLSATGKLATYTTAGRVRDTLVREAGFSPADAAVARTAYITTIRNEVLPLLRSTFGAQFTAMEGEKLETTLGDPNLSPEQKDAALQSFIRTKMETLNSQAREVGQPEPYAQQDIDSFVSSIGEPVQSELPNTPIKGDIVDGYMFLGGEPGNQKSWKKVK